MEYDLRKLYKKLIHRKLEYDPLTGKNNLAEISDKIVEKINKWYEKVYEKYVNNEKPWPTNSVGMKTEILALTREKFGKNFKRFNATVLYFTIIVLLSSIAIRIMKESEGKIKEIREKVTKIYEENNTAFKQYEELQKEGLVGNILFRGVQASVEDILKALKDGVFHTKGRGSWTTDLLIAERFALYENQEMIINDKRDANSKVVTFEQIRKLAEKNKKLEFGSSVSIVAEKEEIEKMIEYVTKPEIATFKFWTIPIIISYNIFEQVDCDRDYLLYIGEHRYWEDNNKEKHISPEKESVFFPNRNKLKLDDASIDLYICNQTYTLKNPADYNPNQKYLVFCNRCGEVGDIRKGKCEECGAKLIKKKRKKKQPNPMERFDKTRRKGRKK
ncbi:MAG: hypothetical protein QF475_02775 [Candidatus Undinarchaeales archaeon]|jgi:ribosomal protein L37E|nr:hypothetical protein [Candidatus Undinarchaeales archaeon]